MNAQLKDGLRVVATVGTIFLSISFITYLVFLASIIFLITYYDKWYNELTVGNLSSNIVSTYLFLLGICLLALLGNKLETSKKNLISRTYATTARIAILLLPLIVIVQDINLLVRGVSEGVLLDMILLVVYFVLVYFTNKFYFKKAIIR